MGSKDSKPAVVIDDPDYNTENYSILRHVENLEDTEAVSDVSFSVFGSNLPPEDVILTRSKSIRDNKEVSTDLPPWLTTCTSVQIEAQINQEEIEDNRNEEVNVEQEDSDEEVVAEWPWLTKPVQVSEDEDSYGPHVIVPGNSFLQDGSYGQYVLSGYSFPEDGSCGHRLKENLFPQAQNNSFGITSPHDGSCGQYVISGYSAFPQGSSRCAVPEDLFPQEGSCGQCVIPKNTFPHDGSGGQYAVSGDSLPVDLFPVPETMGGGWSFQQRCSLVPEVPQVPLGQFLPTNNC